MRLSDAFINPVHGEQPLEVVVKVININYHIKGEILERSEDLKNYSYFVHLVRGFEAERKNLNEAIKLAISTCINENILAEFLKKHQTEVINMLNWDVEEYKKAMREEWREEDREEGIGIEKVAKNMLMMGLSLEHVTKASGLSIDAIKKLQNHAENN